MILMSCINQSIWFRHYDHAAIEVGINTEQDDEIRNNTRMIGEIGIASYTKLHFD